MQFTTLRIVVHKITILSPFKIPVTNWDGATKACAASSSELTGILKPHKQCLIKTSQTLIPSSKVLVPPLDSIIQIADKFTTEEGRNAGASTWYFYGTMLTSLQAMVLLYSNYNYSIE